MGYEMGGPVNAYTVPSFFKIMIGDKFSQLLFLPPKFAHSALELAGQRAILEDSSGQLWKVNIEGESNGSLVFRQGWSVFASDHDLELGDLLVFSRVQGSHFTVKVYDTTSCEKIEFSSSGTTHKADTDEERETVPCVAKKNKVSLPTKNCSNEVNRNSQLPKITSFGLGNNYQHENPKMGVQIMPLRVSNPITATKIKVEPDLNLRNHKDSEKRCEELSKTVETVLPQDVKDCSTMKIETIDSNETTTPIEFSPILATCGQSCIELPECLPYPKHKGSSRERKIVVLQDSAQRLWVVAYHKKPVTQFLADGWVALCNSNGIEPGDRCLFDLKDHSNGIYTIRVVSKKSTDL